MSTEKSSAHETKGGSESASVIASSSAMPVEIEKSSGLVIAHLCLANAKRDEKNDEYRYGARHEQFVNLFREWRNLPDEDRPAVVSLKELRDCKSPDGKSIWTAEEICRRLANELQYKYSLIPVYAQQDHLATSGCFYLAQLYDPKRLKKIEAQRSSYYTAVYADAKDFPTHGAASLCVQYEQKGFPVSSASQVFERFPYQEDNHLFVFTEHFPMDSASKLRSAKMLAECVRRRFQGRRLVVIGDFNLFRDDKDRLEIYETLHSWLSSSLALTDQRKRQIFGTFYPFPHDKPPVEISPPESNDGKASRLDYAFVSGGIAGRISTHVITGLQNKQGVPISDHLPLLVRI